MNIGVMLAAGMGSRYGTEIPKQYVMVRGRELIYYNIDAFKKSKLLDDYIVMVNEKVHISKKIETYYDVKTIVGGATRNESIGKALDWIKENYGGKEPINVFINDVARPMLTSEMIDQYIGLLEDFEYVITCSDIRDALFSKEGIKLPNRKDCFLAAAPEAYRMHILEKYFDRFSEVDFAALQLPTDIKGYYNYNFKTNHKLTYMEDLQIVEMLLDLQQGVK